MGGTCGTYGGNRNEWWRMILEKKNKKKFLGTLKERWENNIRIEFKEMELDDPGYS